MKMSKVCGVLAVCFLAVAAAQADTVTLYSAADSGYSNDTTSTASNGKYGYMNADTGGAGDRRMIIQWDLSSLPVGAVITSATVKVYRFSLTDDPSGDAFSAYKVTSPWTEGNGMSNGGYPVGIDPNGVNWKYSQIATLTEWATPGGDIDVASRVQFLGTAVPDVDNGGVVYGFIFDITDIANSWLTSNNGLIIKSDETVYQRHAMRSRDFGYPDDGQDRPAPGLYAPRLVLEYDVVPVPEPATMSLLVIGGVAALIRRRRQ